MGSINAAEPRGGFAKATLTAFRGHLEERDLSSIGVLVAAGANWPMRPRIID